MTESQTPTGRSRVDILEIFRREYPAISTSEHWGDRVVQQGHADACARWGHAFHKIDGVDQGRCPRCGEVTNPEVYYGDAVETPAPETPAPVVDENDPSTWTGNPAGYTWTPIDRDGAGRITKTTDGPLWAGEFHLFRNADGFNVSAAYADRVNLANMQALKADARTIEQIGERTTRIVVDEDKSAALYALRFTDDMLRADVTEGGYGVLTHSRQAAVLLRLPEQYRRRADAEAHTLSNLIGGIHSGNLSNAANAILANIAAGNPDAELYGERTAREYREREADLRKASGNPAAIYYPPTR